jgi:hypothetical protein
MLIFSTYPRGGSQFWRGLHKVKDLFKWGYVNQVGDGKQTKFWIVVSLGEVPLKIRYHKLYEIY